MQIKRPIFMRIFVSFTAIALFLGVVTTGISSRAESLKIGDPAPALQAGKWIQGDPVSAFDRQHVYVVEFWATWCGPCRASIPHLNDLSQKFKDQNLVVIGQDVWEHEEAGVPGFVNRMGTNMTYRVALDDKSKDAEGAMLVHWLKAARQDGIPSAIIINREGKVAWIGHPMALTEATLQQILDNTFDSAAYAQKFEKAQQDQSRLQAASQTLHQALASEDWDGAEAAAADIEKLLPDDRRYQVLPLRVQILLGRKDFTGAYRLAESASDKHSDDAYLQNELAWDLATTKDLDPYGLSLAGKIAAHAAATSSEKESGILDTLARIQFLKRQTNDAVASEQKAIDAAPDDLKPDLLKVLASYQQGKLPEAAR